MAKDLDNGFDVEKMIAEALAKQEESFNLKLKQREENIISLGCTIVDLTQIDGKPIIDKESGKQKEVNGEPAFYPNKYTCKIAFDGGALETPIKQSDFESLQKNERYLAKGRLSEVKEFGVSLIKPVFSDFIKI